MLPHYIVDGYNVIHAIPTLKKLLAHDGFQAREQLVFLVSRLTFKKKIPMHDCFRRRETA